MGKLTQTFEQIQASISNIFYKEAGNGIKIDPNDPDFPWVDLIGLVIPNSETPSLSPSVEVFRTGVKGFAYGVNEELICHYHIPHDWLLGTDGKLHLHWGHNGTSSSGNLVVTATCCYGDRDGNFGAPVTATFTINTASAAQYEHVVSEIDLLVETPTANQLDKSLIEVDGLLLVTFKVTGMPTIAGGGDLFIFTADLHYQSTGIGTKNNAAPFRG